jgi:hypothetical protein
VRCCATTCVAASSSALNAACRRRAYSTSTVGRCRVKKGVHFTRWRRAPRPNGSTRLEGDVGGCLSGGSLSASCGSVSVATRLRWQVAWCMTGSRARLNTGSRAHLGHATSSQHPALARACALIYLAWARLLRVPSRNGQHVSITTFCNSVEVGTPPNLPASKKVGSEAE